MPAFSATASSASSRATDWAASARTCAVSSSGVWPVVCEVRLGRDARGSRASGRSRSAARARAPRRAAPRASTPEARTSSSTAAARKSASISLVDRRPDPPLDVRAQLGERVELAGRARELVVGLRQHLLVDVLDRHVDRASRSRRRASSAPCACRRRRAPTSAVSISPSSRPEPSSIDRVGLALAVRAAEVDDERVALARLAVVGGHELGDRACERVDLVPDELLGDDRLGARHLEASSSRRSPGVGCTSTVALKRPRLALARTGARSRTRASRRAQPRPRGGAPEPAADVRLDRLGPEALLADVRDAAPAAAPSPCGSLGS